MSLFHFYSPLEAPLGGSAEAAKANATPIKVGSSSDHHLQPAGVISFAAAQSSPIHTPNPFALSYGAPDTAPPAAGPTPVLAAPTVAAPAAVAVVPAAGNASDSSTDTQTSQQALSAMGDQKIEYLTKKLQDADTQVENLTSQVENLTSQVKVLMDAAANNADVVTQLGQHVTELTQEKQELEGAYKEAVVEIQAEKGVCLADYQRRLTAKSRDERRAREANEVAEARIGELELQIEQYEVQAVNQAQSSEEMFEELRDQYESRVLEQTALANVAQFKLEAEIASNNELKTVAVEAETRAGVAETHAAEAEKRAADLAKQLRVAEARAVAAEERAAGLETRTVAAEERAVAAEERAVAAEERAAKAEDMVEKLDAYVKQDANSAEAANVARETAESLNQQLTESNTRSAQLLLDLSNTHAAAETMRIQNDAELNKRDAANAIVQSEVQRLKERLISIDEASAAKDRELAAKANEIKSLKVSCLVSKETKDKASKLDGCQRQVHMERGRVQTVVAENAKLLKQCQQQEEDVKDLTAENSNQEKAYRELEMKYEQVNKENQQLKDGLNQQSNASLERERDSRKREEEESRHRYHRNGSGSDRNRKRSRDDERDHRNQRERHNNYNVDNYRSGADYRPQDRRRKEDEAHRRHDRHHHDRHLDTSYHHRNHNHQRKANGNGSNRNRSSERRTTPHPSPPPTIFQQIDNSQQVLPISTEPPQDPRPQNQQQRQRPQESREEGELSRKKEPFQ